LTRWGGTTGGTYSPGRSPDVEGGKLMFRGTFFDVADGTIVSTKVAPAV
jgi:hypothetical protein